MERCALAVRYQISVMLIHIGGFNDCSGSTEYILFETSMVLEITIGQANNLRTAMILHSPRSRYL